jgi:hypothetical protein
VLAPALAGDRGRIEHARAGLLVLLLPLLHQLLCPRLIALDAQLAHLLGQRLEIERRLGGVVPHPEALLVDLRTLRPWRCLHAQLAELLLARLEIARAQAQLTGTGAQPLELRVGRVPHLSGTHL